MKEQLCIQPIYWHYKTLRKSKTIYGDTMYSASAPTPSEGHWTGYYIELIFPGDTPSTTHFVKNEFIYSTPGFTYPDTLPFDDYHGESVD